MQFSLCHRKGPHRDALCRVVGEHALHEVDAGSVQGGEVPRQVLNRTHNSQLHHCEALLLFLMEINLLSMI